MTFEGLFNFFNQNNESDDETSQNVIKSSKKKRKRSHSVENDEEASDKRQKMESSSFDKNPKKFKNLTRIRRERSPSVEIIEELTITKRSSDTTRYTFNNCCLACKIQFYNICLICKLRSKMDENYNWLMNILNILFTQFTDVDR